MLDDGVSSSGLWRFYVSVHVWDAFAGVGWEGSVLIPGTMHILEFQV